MCSLQGITTQSKECTTSNPSRGSGDGETKPMIIICRGSFIMRTAANDIINVRDKGR